MCGFVGFTGQLADRERVLAAMCKRIAHRGPDATHCYLDNTVALGHCRLAILDTSHRADQPMASADGMVCLVYNGELYNARSLRHSLEAEGYIFRTDCDTEVLLAAYLKWGTSVVAHLRGMFAFVIYDKRVPLLFGARDPFGIKPFYYTQVAGQLLFASEYKAFLSHPRFQPRLRDDALLPYLTFQYNPQDETFLSGVFQLPPGHTLLWREGVSDLRRYVTLAPAESAPIEATALHDILAESVSAHAHSDVPVASFLSGGVDSGYITALLRPSVAYSVGFAERQFDECGLAEKLCKDLRLTHTTEQLSMERCLSMLSRIQYHMDDPQANPSAIPLYFLSALAAKQHKVVLSGEGADELFAGYAGYLDTPIASAWQRLPSALRHSAASIAWKLPRGHLTDLAIHGSDPTDGFIGQAYLLSPQEATALLRTPYREGATPREITAPYFAQVQDAHPLLQKQYLDLCLWLPRDILQKADKMTMAHGLELRTPFLDREVFRAANQIPTEERCKNGIGKHPLRQAAEKILPAEVAWREKKGFPVPIQGWLRTPLGRQILDSYFATETAGAYFDVRKLQARKEAHYNGAKNGRSLYAILAFLLWHEHFLEKKNEPLLNQLAYDFAPF